MNAITYHIIDSIEEMYHAEELQQIVWGMSPNDTLSATLLNVMVHIGGLLLGAWDGDKLVGFCIGFPGNRQDDWVLWSDMAGVHPNYQGQGIGYTLKIKQRQWAYDRGYQEIRWTFDPMRSGNASFNFHKLGAVSWQYHPSFYGAMEDNINKGLPSDRLEAVWTTSPTPTPKQQYHDDPVFVVEYDGKQIQSQMRDDDIVCIQIPDNLDLLKQNNLPLAINWQENVRHSFINYFRNGYYAVNFVKVESKCWYILHKKI